MRTVLAVMALIFVAGVTTASAQQVRAPASRPEVILRDQDIFRPPPRSPAERPYPPPRPEIGGPMEPLPPLPEMKPRVGND
jgi:hypothetical protein